MLIQSDLKNLGIKVIFQPVEFNTLIKKLTTPTITIASCWVWPAAALTLISGMNVVKSDGFTHQWFPRQKTPFDRLGSADGLF